MKTEAYEAWVPVGHLTVEVLRYVNPFDLGVLLLGYCLVITSWSGYHRSIKAQQINLDTLAGQIRFALDVLLLLIYCLILTRFADFTFVLCAIVVVFFVFFLWDQAKCRESQGEKPDSARRRGVTVAWLFVFAFLLLLESYAPCVSRWIILTLAVSFTFLYRLHKNHSKLIFDWMAWPFPEQ